MRSGAALVAALIMSASQIGSLAVQCAGWQSSAQARMACCAAKHADCPVVASPDACCASAEQGQQPSGNAPVPLPVGPPVALAAIPHASGIDIVLATRTEAARSFERATLVIPPDPTHLVDSVFLI
ncbi:MAG: hypothetical protein ACRD1S_00150 [Vicinamibacterales bacterium]